jgi:formylglycine-generating enzyme required for sulfatase activity
MKTFKTFTRGALFFLLLISSLGMPILIVSDGIAAMSLANGLSEPGDIEEVFVPTGPFAMGCAHDLFVWGCDSDTVPVHQVYIDAFYIDKFEVTNAQYAACVAAGVCSPPLETSSDSREHYYDNPTYNSFPVIHVDWYRANTYCRWLGKRLPTEAEWEKAARGTELYKYPWGNALANCDWTNMLGCVRDTVAVGSYPHNASPYGALDMAGNVSEWISDFYDKHYYKSSPYYNPQGPDEGREHLVRGGSWENDTGGVTTYIRLDESEIYHRERIGFRCARSAVGGTPTPSPTPSPTLTPMPTPTPTPFAVGEIGQTGGAVWMATPKHLTLLHVPENRVGSRAVFTITYEDYHNVQDGLQGVNHFFKLDVLPNQPTATNYIDGQLYPAQELFLGFQEPYGVKYETLRLYRLGPSGWTTQHITLTERTAGYVRAQIQQTGVYGLLGLTDRLYLPLITRYP